MGEGARGKKKGEGARREGGGGKERRMRVGKKFEEKGRESE